MLMGKPSSLQISQPSQHPKRCHSVLAVSVRTTPLLNNAGGVLYSLNRFRGSESLD